MFSSPQSNGFTCSTLHRVENHRRVNRCSLGSLTSEFLFQKREPTFNGVLKILLLYVHTEQALLAGNQFEENDFRGTNQRRTNEIKRPVRDAIVVIRNNSLKRPPQSD